MTRDRVEHEVTMIIVGLGFQDQQALWHRGAPGDRCGRGHLGAERQCTVVTDVVNERVRGRLAGDDRKGDPSPVRRYHAPLIRDVVLDPVTEVFLAQHLGGNYEPIDDDLANSSAQVKAGADLLPGLEK